MTSQAIPKPVRGVGERPTRLGLMLTPHSTITLTSPPWIRSVVDRIDYLLSTLVEGWDAEGGLPLDFDTAMECVSFLLQMALHETPAPQIVPTSLGGLQLEWHTAGSDLEITFEPNAPPVFFYVSPEGKEIEGNAEIREDLVGELIRELPSRDKSTPIER
jgi:hypothetical protein